MQNVTRKTHARKYAMIFRVLHQIRILRDGLTTIKKDRTGVGTTISEGGTETAGRTIISETGIKTGIKIEIRIGTKTGVRGGTKARAKTELRVLTGLRLKNLRLLFRSQAM